MSAHTSGPWTVNGKQSIRGPNGEYVASASWQNGPANARLIAMAPAMLSAVLENAMVTGLEAYQCREQRRDSASRAAHNRLRDECIDALMHDPARTVDTPSYPNESSMPAVKAVLYVYDAQPQLLLETLLIVAQVARGEVDFYARQVLHLRAKALIAAQGQQHAADHRDALVEFERDDRSDEERDEDARDDAIDWRSERQREERAFGEA